MDYETRVGWGYTSGKKPCTFTAPGRSDEISIHLPFSSQCMQLHF